jgi:hypothetical protein
MKRFAPNLITWSRSIFLKPETIQKIKDKNPDLINQINDHIHQSTSEREMKIQQNKIGDLIIDFIDKNQYNCDFAFLWHNNYFTNYKYKGFLEEYKKIVIYLNENKIETLNPRELVDQNKLTW